MLIEYTQLIRNGEVKSRRLALGMRQKDLAREIGACSTAIGHIESFRMECVSKVLVDRLAKYFDVSPDVLVPPWLWEMEAIPTKITTHAEVGEGGFRLLAQSQHRALASSGKVVENLVIAEEEARNLVTAYGKLPHRHQTAMRLYAEGYSIRQIAKKLKCGVTWAFKQINYVIGTLMIKVPDVQEHTRDEVAALLAYGLHRDRKTLASPRGGLPNRMHTRINKASVGNDSLSHNGGHGHGARSGDMVRIVNGEPKVLAHRVRISIPYENRLRPIVEKILLSAPRFFTKAEVVARILATGEWRDTTMKSLKRLNANVLWCLKGLGAARRGQKKSTQWALLNEGNHA